MDKYKYMDDAPEQIGVDPVSRFWTRDPHADDWRFVRADISEYRISVLEAENARLRLQLSAMRAQASGVTWVCPECDIAGCRHFREAVG